MYVKENNLLPAAHYPDIQERCYKAANLGLHALAKSDRWKRISEGDLKDKESLDDAVFWFLFEDQTIGLPEVADLAIQGKSKNEIKELIREAYEIDVASNKYDDIIDDDNVPLWSLSELKYDIDPIVNSTFSDNTEAYIDACIKLAKKKRFK